MSVDYDALLGIGKRFSAVEEAGEFILSHTNLTVDQVECLEDGGDHQGMTLTCLDCYSGEDWFVGFEIGGDSPDTLINHVVDAHERWKAIFKSVEPRVVHAVKIW